MAAFPAYPMLIFPGPRRQREPGVKRTEMESGPPKQLKTQSRVMINREVGYLLKTLADYNNFVTFFETTINRGTDWFDWTDPVDGQVKLARIRAGELAWEEPQRKDQGLWKVSFVIETWNT